MKTVWVFTGSTESGDDVGPYVFAEKPDTYALQHVLMEDWPSEFGMSREEWIDPNFGYISCHSLKECTIL